jgi:hypothetical protein
MDHFHALLREDTLFTDPFETLRQLRGLGTTVRLPPIATFLLVNT